MMTRGQASAACLDLEAWSGEALRRVISHQHDGVRHRDTRATQSPLSKLWE
jgi:hypothetical protein